MQEIKLSKGTIKIIWDEKEYFIKKPTLGKALELEKSVEAANGSNISDLQSVLDFIVDSGLPRDVLMELHVEALEAILLALMPPKKK